MRAHTYIQLRYANQVMPGFHVEVSDDHSKAIAGFLGQDELPHDAVLLATWCFRETGAAAILQAAIERGESIGTSWGEASSAQVARRLAMLSAQRELGSLDQVTAMARGASKGPRL